MSLLAALVLYGKDFLVQWCTILQEVFADNVWIVLVCGLFGSLIALLQSQGEMTQEMWSATTHGKP